MRLVNLAGSALMLFGSVALAAEGDALIGSRAMA